MSTTIEVNADDLDKITKRLKRAARPEPSEIPTIPHLSGEFMLWLWWVSDINGSVYNFDGAEEGESVSIDELDSVEMWIDDRITMRPAMDNKVSNVMTGDTIATAPEAKVAIATGKVVHEIRMGLRREDREYVFGLKGPELLLHGVKVPSLHSENDGLEGIVYERLALLEELETIIARLFLDFGRIRSSEAWNEEIVPEIQNWLDTDNDGL